MVVFARSKQKEEAHIGQDERKKEKTRSTD
jgi:hypothetical protein